MNDADPRRYLTAKATVDDRARNRRVSARLADAVGDRDALSVLDVGSGLGHALDHLLSLGLPVAEYVGVDADAGTVAAARDDAPVRLAAAGYEVGGDDPLTVRANGGQASVEFVAADAAAFVADAERRFDLLVGESFVDLFGASEALDDLLPALAPGGVWYFPITFDGGTTFLPALDRALDDAVERRYHEHMDDIRDAPGGSRAGRRLLDAARRRDGVTVLAAGGSDWVVRPHRGAYPHDEAHFLGCIVDSVDGALADHPAVDDAERERWVDRRREHLAAGELTYVAHQLDVLGRVD